MSSFELEPIPLQELLAKEQLSLLIGAIATLKKKDQDVIIAGLAGIDMLKFSQTIGEKHRAVSLRHLRAVEKLRRKVGRLLINA